MKLMENSQFWERFTSSFSFDGKGQNNCLVDRRPDEKAARNQQLSLHRRNEARPEV